MGAGRGSASAMMSFHDFAHTFHRFGILSFAEDAARLAGGREEKEADEEAKGPAATATATAMRTVFDNASRGNWPGDGKVGFRWPDLTCFLVFPENIVEEKK